MIKPTRHLPARTAALLIVALMAWPTFAADDANKEAVAREAAEQAAKVAAEREVELQKLRIQLRAQQIAAGRDHVDQDALDKIALPDNPTRDDVAKYIHAILRASADQRRFSSRDPQVDMFRAVPDEHFDLLLNLDLQLNPGSRYIRYALDGETAERHKAQIIAALPDNPWLVSVIAANRWIEECRDVLVEAVNRDPSNVSYSLLRYAAQVDGPAVRDAMLERLITGPQRTSVYTQVSDIPGDALELDAAVALAWEQSAQTGASDHQAFARYAMLHGHVDARNLFIDRYRPQADALKRDDLNANQRRAYESILERYVLIAFDYPGQPKDFYDWYDAYRDKLQWDSYTRKYFLPTSG